MVKEKEAGTCLRFFLRSYSYQEKNKTAIFKMRFTNIMTWSPGSFPWSMPQSHWSSKLLIPRSQTRLSLFKCEIFAELNLFSFYVSSLHFVNHELSRIRQLLTDETRAFFSWVHLQRKSSSVQGNCLDFRAPASHTLSLLLLRSQGSLCENSATKNGDVPRFSLSAPFIFLVKFTALAFSPNFIFI